ncbi:uncharacterized protein LOC128554638 [Mercenaria mercenaria]|uniref:uncharacterized protein LOC128554638 n=1 Tax=Mercenaria mercenaria TaxID=6596 RepID=UPI00234F0D68|nr:uncharacterized protein LOC128554638 [Mercenaria mercenaria]
MGNRASHPESIEWKFVGRDAEMRKIKGLLFKKKSVLVFGMKKIGKSRFIEELYRHLCKNEKYECLIQDFESDDIELGHTIYNWFINFLTSIGADEEREHFVNQYPSETIACHSCEKCQLPDRDKCLKRNDLIKKAIYSVIYTLGNFKCEFVLFLDNINKIMDSPLKDSFLHFHRLSLKCPNLRIVLASANKPKQMTKGYESFELKPLDKKAILEILFETTEQRDNYSDDEELCSETVSYSPKFRVFKKENEPYMEAIVSLCEGLPLAAIMSGMLLTEDDCLLTLANLVEILICMRLTSLSPDNCPPDDRLEIHKNPKEEVKGVAAFFNCLNENMTDTKFSIDKAATVVTDASGDVETEAMVKHNVLKKALDKSILCIKSMSGEQQLNWHGIFRECQAALKAIDSIPSGNDTASAKDMVLKFMKENIVKAGLGFDEEILRNPKYLELAIRSLSCKEKTPPPIQVVEDNEAVRMYLLKEHHLASKKAGTTEFDTEQLPVMKAHKGIEHYKSVENSPPNDSRKNKKLATRYSVSEGSDSSDSDSMNLQYTNIDIRQTEGSMMNDVNTHKGTEHYKSVENSPPNEYSIDQAVAAASDASDGGDSEAISTVASGHVTRSLHRYTVPLSFWKDLDQSQKSIKYMLEFCDGVEKTAGYTKYRQEADICEVDIFIDTDLHEIESLVPDVCKRELHTWNVFEETDDKSIVSNFKKGVVVDSGGPKLVKSLNEPNITVLKEDGSWCIEDTCDDTFKTNDSMKIKCLIERVIFEPLIERCEFLGQVLDALNTASVSEKYHSEVRDKMSKFETARPKDRGECFDEKVLAQFKQQRDTVEGLFEEMVAAISRSHLNRENVIRLKGYLENRSVSKEVSEELFRKEQTVKGCGYRLKTLHVDVERLPTKEENDDREQRIREFLSNHDITDVKVNFVSPTLEEYSYVGAHIGLKSDTVLKTGTLGCFANHSKDQKSSLCALLSKHVAQGCSSEILIEDKDKNLKIFGKILPDTYVDGGHDIVAGVVEGEHISNCDMGFRSIENKKVPGELYSGGDTTNLQGHPIHLWGAKSKPGIGKVTVQNYHFADDNDTYIEVQDGSVALGKPDAVLAKNGDSGAIVCMDESGGERVRVISMLMGPKNEIGSQNDLQVKRKYLTLPLSSGLRTLEKRTNGTFQLQGTDTSVKSAGKMLDPTSLFAENNDEGMHEEEPRNQRE